MKDHIKDTVLICKGHWDHEKHSCTFAALLAYWQRETMCQHISVEHIITCLLTPVLEQQLSEHIFVSMVQDLVRAAGNWPFDVAAIDGNMGYVGATTNVLSCLCGEMIRKIHLLPVRDTSKNIVFIDLSDYDDTPII